MVGFLIGFVVGFLVGGYAVGHKDQLEEWLKRMAEKINYKGE